MKRVLLILLVACKQDAPAKPDLTGMGLEQQCLATAPRGQACALEIMIATAGTIDDGLGAATAEALKDEPDSSKGEALELHHVTCLGDPSYPARLVRCWDQPDCKALAACVYPGSRPPKTGQSPQ